jgi:hypothetical protein
LSIALHVVRFEPVLPTLNAVMHTFCAVAGASTVTSKPCPGTVGGEMTFATPCVATGGSGRFATTVRLSTPSTAICTVSAVAGWSASVARPLTRMASWLIVWRARFTWTTGLFDGGGGGFLTQISSTRM